MGHSSRFGGGTPGRWGSRSLPAGVLVICAVCCCFLLMSSTAFAHVPQLVEGGTSLDTATFVEAPATSWVYYGEITQPGEARYYRMEFAAGERIYLQVITPERDGFSPGLALMGPGLEPVGTPPDFLEIPDEGTVIVAEGTPGEAEYEPFTPGAYYYPATIDMAAPEDGTYYAAVFHAEAAGAYGLAIGYEERYTVPAWIRLPADLLNIYAWDGGWAITLLPVIAVLAVGVGLVWWRQVRGGRKRGLSGWLSIAAGLLYLTTAGVILVQLLRALGLTGLDPAMGITALFVVAPLILGALLIWLGWSSRMSAPAAANTATAAAPGLGTRMLLILLALAGLGLLAGYLLGPALALAAAVVPPYKRL